MVHVWTPVLDEVRFFPQETKIGGNPWYTPNVMPLFLHLILVQGRRNPAEIGFEQSRVISRVQTYFPPSVVLPTFFLVVYKSWGMEKLWPG